MQIVRTNTRMILDLFYGDYDVPSGNVETEICRINVAALLLDFEMNVCFSSKFRSDIHHIITHLLINTLLTKLSRYTRTDVVGVKYKMLIEHVADRGYVLETV